MKLLAWTGRLLLPAILFLALSFYASAQSGRQDWGGQPEVTALQEKGLEEKTAPFRQYRVSAHWLAGGLLTLIVLVALLLVNIRQRIKANRQLSARNKMLHQAKEELRENLERLENTNENLNNFLFAASHDLKESVRSMTSFGQLLERKLSEGEVETAGHYLGFIIESGKRMDQALEKLLFFSGLQGIDQLARAAVNLEQSARRAWDGLQRERKDYSGSLEIAPLPEVFGDPDLFYHLAIYLLENAIEFRKEEKGLAVELCFRPDSQAGGVFVLKDNGQGVGPEYLESIFMPFQRLNPRGKGGAGLGLSICRRIVELHNGRIWAEAAEEGGLAIFFSLPLSGKAADEPAILK
ncbi:MAG: hypothetical protein KDD06_10500 [Phaeodactylibacter sp.]|nr:hypothetical protein [Phaeodactylibacter sp.]MCB9267446.1 hypothetical protein [Lewinellaceae bacterium]MCB9288748.1 hypothetical protein [Lewinellaceae bacterium]